MNIEEAVEKARTDHESATAAKHQAVETRELLDTIAEHVGRLEKYYIAVDVTVRWYGPRGQAEKPATTPAAMPPRLTPEMIDALPIGTHVHLFTAGGIPHTFCRIPEYWHLVTEIGGYIMHADMRANSTVKLINNHAHLDKVDLDKTLDIVPGAKVVDEQGTVYEARSGQWVVVHVGENSDVYKVGDEEFGGLWQNNVRPYNPLLPVGEQVQRHRTAAVKEPAKEDAASGYLNRKMIDNLPIGSIIVCPLSWRTWELVRVSLTEWANVGEIGGLEHDDARQLVAATLKAGHPPLNSTQLEETLSAGIKAELVDAAGIVFDPCHEEKIWWVDDGPNSMPSAILGSGGVRPCNPLFPESKQKGWWLA